MVTPSSVQSLAFLLDLAVVLVKVDPTPFIGEFAGRDQVVWDVGHA